MATPTSPHPPTSATPTPSEQPAASAPPIVRLLALKPDIARVLPNAETGR